MFLQDPARGATLDLEQEHAGTCLSEPGERGGMRREMGGGARRGEGGGGGRKQRIYSELDNYVENVST